jgi:hypothetical protein
MDWERMQSKRRWYMAWEAANLDGASTLSILRRYDHVNLIRTSTLKNIPPEWSTFFDEKAIRKAVADSSAAGEYWWDSEVSKLLRALHPGIVSTLGLKDYAQDSEFENFGDKENDRYHRALRGYWNATRFLAQKGHVLIPRLALRALDNLFDIALRR